MTTLATSLYSRSLELAAGVPVNAEAYEQYCTEGDMNLAKLQVLGKAFRQGWLHNVLARITPLTARETTDYERMASLFITSPKAAEALLAQMSRDLSRFATAAGLLVNSVIPMALLQHTNLYQKIATQMADMHGIKAPKAFASTTIDAATQADMPFIRQYVRERFAA
jgi:hypothetical protein